ncbi:MAG: 23S rRNA (adenine(2503)-C(2))-methyltransferase RlmN [Deltaproteobacteria bacterium]|nr:23S rRNA (adenine(2503)-C(2))-methyltransferase RlmN [Deltaproteobacteria bacterium]
MKSLRPHIKDYTRDALRAEFKRRGFSSYRADQVLSWVYRHGVEDFCEMKNLPIPLRTHLEEEWDIRSLVERKLETSIDGTRKLVLETHDKEVIEAVLIPEERRNTLCVSTQVGCPLACSFCATGALGLTRNLRTGEIVDQVLRARAVLPEEEVITNVVFMGMGEPLLNLSAVTQSVSLLTDPKALAMAPRRITVSTSGLVPQIRPLLEVGPINLAVSLHATTDEVRDELVPLNRRFPIDVLLGALRSEPLLSRKRPVFFEYTLMRDVNDSLEDAARLPRLLNGIPSKLNVIPMNPHPDAVYQPPDRKTCDAFAQVIHRAGMRVTLRRNRGSDIDAACGQLAAREVRGKATAPRASRSENLPPSSV